MSDKPMKWAVGLAEAVAGNSDWEWVLSYGKEVAASYAERRANLLPIIQRAAEPLMAVVRESVQTRKNGVTWCRVCFSDDTRDAGLHLPDCPVPAALKAMEVCNE